MTIPHRLTPDGPDGGLDEEIAQLRQFVELLKREQSLLKKDDSESLLSLVNDKNDLADKIAVLSRKRETQLAQLKLPSGRPGMEAWLAQPGNQHARHSWNLLLELTATARDLNILNGKLIGLHMQHNQQALQILMSATNRASTYGPDGQQQTGFGSRILGKA